MAVPREVIRIPKLRGLHDFPERAPIGSAAVATNVEFVNGGVQTRGGVNIIGTQDLAGNTLLTPRGLWNWTHPSGRSFIILGWVASIGDDAGKGYISVFDDSGVFLTRFGLSDSTDTVHAGYNGHHLMVPASPGGRNSNYGARYNFLDDSIFWAGTAFHPAGLPVGNPETFFVISTEKQLGYVNVSAAGGAFNKSYSGRDAQMWALVAVPGGGLECHALHATDRERFAYWGGETPSSASFDDAGPYLYTGPPHVAVGFDEGHASIIDEVGGHSLVNYKNRLVVAGHSEPSQSLAVRFSNFGDLALSNQHGGVATTGWPANNVFFLPSTDSTAVTALHVWYNYLLVFQERTLTVLTFDDIQNAAVVGVFAGVGAVGPGAVVSGSRNGRDVIFFTSADGFYAYDGQLTYISGPIEKSLRGRLSAEYFRAVVAYRPEVGQVWFQCEVRQAHEKRSASQWFIFHINTGDWTVFDFGGNKFFDVALVTNGPNAPNIQRLVGANVDTQGKINLIRLTHSALTRDLLESGASASQFYRRYELQRVAYGRHQVRRWSFLRLSQEEFDDNGNVRVYWKMDNQSHAAAIAAGQYTNINSIAGSPDTFGTHVFGNANFGELGFFQTRVALHGGPARWFRFGIENGSAFGGATNTHWHVNAVELDTRRKEGRR